MLCSLSSISVCYDGSGRKYDRSRQRQQDLRRRDMKRTDVKKESVGNFYTVTHQLSRASVRLLMFCNIVVY